MIRKAAKPLMLFVMVLGIMYGSTSSVFAGFAAPWPSPDCSNGNTSDGRCANVGYFSGLSPMPDFSYPNNVAGVLPNTYSYADPVSGGSGPWAFPGPSSSYYSVNGMASGQAAANFVAFINSYLNAPNPGGCSLSQPNPPTDMAVNNGTNNNSGCWAWRREKLGAAFLVLTMVGGTYTDYPGSAGPPADGPGHVFNNNVTTGFNQAKAVFPLWSQEVIQADANGLVDWDKTVTLNGNHTDSTSEDYGHDVGIFVNTVSQVPQTIYFTLPGGTYIINRSCGNTDKHFVALPAPVAATATCAGYITDVSTPDPNQLFNLTVSIQFSPNSGASTVFGPDTMSAQLTGPSPYAGTSKSTTTPTITNGVASMKLPVSATNVPGTFNLTWKITGSQAPTVSCSDTVTVAYSPYFAVRGGDVSAGQGFGNNCIDNPGADIDGQNQDDGALPANYFGASTSNAAIATGEINQFATDTVNNVPSNLGGSSDGLTTNQPSGLAIANNTTTPPMYGGNALGSWAGNWCVPDYATNAGTTSGAFNSASLVSGTYTLSGSTIGGFTVPAGVHITVIASAGVYINGDIKYASYSSLSQVPQFTLLVKGGDTYVSNSVKELHGFYDIQPDAAAVGGNLYTCATALGAASTNYATCNTPLTFYGAVASGQIIPGRTAGDAVKGASVSDVPAEQFVYTPELWLGAVTAPTTTCAQDPTQANCMYVTYTNLPPTL